MVRTRHYGGDPSAHDSTGPRDKGDIRRPLGAPPPDNPGLKSRAGKGCVVVILTAAGSVFGAGWGVVEAIQVMAS